MNRLKLLLWDFNFLIKRTNFAFITLCNVVALVMLAVTLGENSRPRSEPLSHLDQYSIYLLFLFVVIGIVYNKKKWSIHFFIVLVNSLMLTVLRVLLLLVFCLLFSGLVKFLLLLLFQISPYELDKFFGIVSRVILYYPILQIPLFSIQYKKSSQINLAQ